MVGALLGGEDLWLSLLEHVVLPAGRAFEPELVLVSAGFDAHRADPLASRRLETSSFAQMACQVREQRPRSATTGSSRSAWPG